MNLWEYSCYHHCAKNIILITWTYIALDKKMKFSIKHFFSKCDQIRSFLRIWSRLLQKPLSGKLHFLYSVKYSNHIDIGRKLFGNLSSTISDILFSMQEVLATITKFMALLAFLGTVH